ncbi:Helicase associated domain protein [Streptomyces sp. NPDC058690]|uniref:Helicase associated domain protein n=1 Tax=Streptomyces sp. NPDC058690 TaxID=3346600 RepID=UPI00364706A1
MQPGVHYQGDDLGQWIQQQARDWVQLTEEQQRRLTTLGLKPREAPAPAPAAKRAAKSTTKAQQAFQRGLTALAQWVAREGTERPVPRGHLEPILVEGVEHELKLGVWISNTKTRRDKLTVEQRSALAELGVEWA